MVYYFYELIFIGEQKEQEVGESFTWEVMFKLGFEGYCSLAN